MTSLPKIFSVVFISLFCLLSFGQEESEKSPHFELSVPLVLIRGIEYPFSYGTDMDNFVYSGRGLKIKKNKGVLTITAKYDSIYHLDISKVSNLDTIFIERIYFDVVWQPRPKVSWGTFDPILENISVSRDSIDLLQTLFIECGWQDSRNLHWEILKGEIYFNDEHYNFIGNKLDANILDELAKCIGETKVQVVLTFKGPDEILRKYVMVKTVSIDL